MMSISSKFRTIFRGDLRLIDLRRELLRRRRAANRQKNERHEIEAINASAARLAAQFEALSSAQLLACFRERRISFFPFDGPDGLERITRLQLELFSAETEQLIAAADR